MAVGTLNIGQQGSTPRPGRDDVVGEFKSTQRELALTPQPRLSAKNTTKLGGGCTAVASESVASAAPAKACIATMRYMAGACSRTPAHGRSVRAD